MKTIYRVLLLLVLWATIMFVYIDVTAEKVEQIEFPALSSERIIELVNDHRELQNLPPLTANQQLNLAAQAKAEHMVANNYFAHTSPTGKKPWDFIKEAGYKYEYAGENLAAGYYDEEELVNDWMNSQSHRSNILSKEYKEIGIGIKKYHDNNIVVQEFGSPAKQNNSNKQ